MGPMPQPAENVFAQRMGVSQPQPVQFGANPPAPINVGGMQLPMQPMWGANPPRNILGSSGAPGLPERSPLPPMSGQIPLQGQPSGIPPQNGQPAYPAPGMLQSPDVQNFLRRRLMMGQY